ncbi:Gfo/Idh/MocA family protein [Vibrio splendidus]|uniref:Gfo/Idh/MocA family protein n=1 Tax=Vibrio splendidus TaxID=29497 RepID=UPI003D11ED84
MKRVAVIGLGNIATRHRQNLKQLFPNATLYGMSASGRVPDEAVSDCDKLVSSLSELISLQVELVIVASPAPFHAEQAIPLLEAGIPTLIEKPVTTTLEDANRIQLAAEKHLTPVTIGYCLRYLPSAKKLHTLLSNNKIGTLYNVLIDVGQYLPDWRPSKDYRDCVSANKKLGGGALFELSHELDYAQWLLGPLTLQHAILRSSEALALDVEDIADITALTTSGAVATIHLDFLQRKAHRQCSFVGSEGRIDWDLIQNQLTLTTATDVSVLYGEPEWDKNQMYIAMIEDFVQRIEQNKHSCTELAEATATVHLIEQIKLQACLK